MTIFSSSGLETIALAAAQLEAQKSLESKNECGFEQNHNPVITNYNVRDSLVADDASSSCTDAIIKINKNDVLCGRGGETNHHNGNIQYRRLVKMHQYAYLEAKRREKPLIAKKIVDQIRNQNPSGRFLKKVGIGDKLVWKDVGNIKAREKTSQALREGAPEIRDRYDSKSLLSSSDGSIAMTNKRNGKIGNGPSELHSSSNTLLDPRQVSHLTSNIVNFNTDMSHLMKKRKRPFKLQQDGFFKQQHVQQQAHSFQNDRMTSNASESRFQKNILLSHGGPLYGMKIHLSHGKKYCLRGPRIRIFKARMRMEMQQQQKHNMSSNPHRISTSVNYIIH